MSRRLLHQLKSPTTLGIGVIVKGGNQNWQRLSNDHKADVTELVS